MGGYMKEYERYQLELMVREGHGVTYMAKMLGRCRSTVYNELERGKTQHLKSDLTKETVYDAYSGQRVTEERSHNKGAPLKIGNDMAYVRKVEELVLKKKYSPYAALEHIRRECPEIRTRVCLTTLYSYIHGGLFLHVTRADLPYRRRKKKKNREVPARVPLNNRRGKSIDMRPGEVTDRTRRGDWEMDTVVGGKGKSRECLLVLTERMGRFELLRRMPDKSSASAVSVLDELERGLGTALFRETFRTITTDNGCEFLDPDGLERSVSGGKRTEVYHCHPYRSNERASNEKNNQMLRRWFPKGSSLSGYTDGYIQAAEDWLNDYPRAMFGGKSAREVYARGSP